MLKIFEVITMNMLKKAVSQILVLCLLLTCFVTGVSAVENPKETIPLSAGIERLRAEFEFDVADEDKKHLELLSSENYDVELQRTINNYLQYYKKDVNSLLKIDDC